MLLELQFTPLRDSYTAVTSYPVVEINYDGGALNKRGDPLFCPHEVTLGFRLVSPQQYTAFMGFFRTTLKEATEFFLLDLVVDVGVLIPHICRTKGGMPKLDQVDGNSFYVSCPIEVQVNPTYTGNILYTGPNQISFTHTSPRLVGPIQPGDTVRVLNSAGTHPNGTTQWIFDGIDDEVAMGDVLDMTRTTARSVFGWYTTDEYGNAILSKQAAVNNTGWRFTVSSNPDEDLILCGPSGIQQIQVGANPRPPVDNLEHHFGWTYTGSSTAAGVTMYLDGSATGKTVGTDNLTSANITNSQPLQIGNRGTTAPFEGKLRHITVWNRDLTSLEVSQLYNGGVPPDVSDLSFFSDCIGWWKLDANDTATPNGIIDYSVSGNDGTANFSPAVSDGSTDLDLDGIYEVESVDPDNKIMLVDPDLVNPNWLLLADLGPYGSELLGNVTSTVVRYPRNI